MSYRRNTFHRLVAMIITLVIAMILMYSYSHQTSIRVIENQLTMDSLDKLTFLQKEMESNVEQLDKLTQIVGNDTGVRDFVSPKTEQESKYISIQKKSDLMDVLSWYSLTSNWENRLTVYSPETHEQIGNGFFNPSPYDSAYMKDYVSKGWQYIPPKSSQEGYFVRMVVYPPSLSNNIEQADFFVEMKFSDINLVSMLDHYQFTASSDPFLFHPEYSPILSHKSDGPKVQELIAKLKETALSDSGNLTATLSDGDSYLISYFRSSSLDWYLIDYVPLQEIIGPIQQKRNLFFIGTSILLLMSMLLTFSLYRNVQLPIKELIHNVQKLKQGNYSVRLTRKPDNEFSFLYSKFNDMAEQIQDLIEKVLAEKLRVKEATLKQLQSQINPHFLYNCLFFIVGMARQRDHEAVEVMAQNLSDYYRYSTRLDQEETTIQEELDLIKNYMYIQNMRMDRLQYEIDIPEELQSIRIPRLLLQPIVENAVIHGIEPKEGIGIIRITMCKMHNQYRFSVEDNGLGMPEEERRSLYQRITQTHYEGTGFALWNTHQRLFIRYGEEAGIQIEPSPLGGLKVTLYWTAEAP
jgi:two-component system sensor histidine kinase YesM